MEKKIKTLRAGLLFNHSEIVGGGELSLLDLANALRAHGVEPIAVVPARGDIADRLAVAGIETVIIEWLPLRDAGLMGFVRTVRSMVRYFHGLRLDVVHANGARCMIYAGVAARLAGIPCVWHVRVLDRDRCLDVVRGLLASAVIANSKSTAASLRAVGVSAGRIKLIYNGFNIANLDRVKPVDPATLDVAGHAVVLAVGRLCRWKRFELLFEACASLARSGLPVVCLIVGRAVPEEKAYEDELRAHARKLKAPVVFAGWRDDVAGIMKASSVLVLPSKAEPFGRVVVEAMACGLPVVAGREGGPLEIIHDGTDGLLANPDDPKSFAEAIRRVLIEPGLSERLRSAGRVRAMDFNLDRHAAAVAGLYRMME